MRRGAGIPHGVRLHPAVLCGARHAEFPGLNICTVIGFPLGYNTTACKVFETQQAVREGASEVDMVVNLGDVKNGDFDAVEKEIEALKRPPAIMC